MTGGQWPFRRQRLRAPREHGQTLIEPSLGVAGDLYRRNAAYRLAFGGDCHLGELSLRDLASRARAEMLATAQEYTRGYRDVPNCNPAAPIFLSGHQPQLFHAGVWFKNFVLGQLARRHNATAVNLVVDGDTLRAASIRVPGGSVANPTAEAVPFDASGPEIPFEERAVLAPEVFASFGQRAEAELAPLVRDPLLKQLWPLAVERARATGKLGLSLAQSRHQLEAKFGPPTLEIPQSRLCQLPSFSWFAAHLLAELPRLHAVYNAAVARYRRENRLRSANHPVPDLAVEDEWLEAPLWVWQANRPRRRRLFAKQTGRELRLADRAGWETRFPLAPDSSLAVLAAALGELHEQGVRLRTRALITTMWCRLALGDLFLHGIGGAKYDQLTDGLIHDFFGLQPPAYLTVTATLRLPIERNPVGGDELAAIDRRLRDLQFHPETFDLDVNDAHHAALAARKRDLVAEQPTKDNSRARCQSIRAINRELSQSLAGQRELLLASRDEIAARLRAEAVLASREYAYCLFPEKTLRDFLLEFV